MRAPEPPPVDVEKLRERLDFFERDPRKYVHPIGTNDLHSLLDAYEAKCAEAEGLRRCMDEWERTFRRGTEMREEALAAARERVAALEALVRHFNRHIIPKGFETMTDEQARLHYEVLGWLTPSCAW